MLKSKSLPLLASAAALGLVLASQPASAEIIKTGDVSNFGQGFGAVPRLVTAQIGNQNLSPEWACNANVGGALVQGPTACNAGKTTAQVGDATFNGNNLVKGTVGFDGNTSENNKNTLLSTSAIVGVDTNPFPVTSASQLRLLYNPSQQGANDPTDIWDLTLKFYNAANQIVISIDGGCGGLLGGSCSNNASDPLFFANTGTNLGNGGVGFVLGLDATQAAAVDQACGGGLGPSSPCKTITGDMTINLNNDGPDSIALFAVPSPLIGHGLLALLGIGGVLFGGKLSETLKKRHLRAA